MVYHLNYFQMSQLMILCNLSHMLSGKAQMSLCKTYSLTRTFHSCTYYIQHLMNAMVASSSSMYLFIHVKKRFFEDALRTILPCAGLKNVWNISMRYISLVRRAEDWMKYLIATVNINIVYIYWNDWAFIYTFNLKSISKCITSKTSKRQN